MLKFFVPLRERFDLNMKEILQVKMDLAFHFILLLNWVVRKSLITQIFSDNSMFSEFPHHDPPGSCFASLGTVF